MQVNYHTEHEVS